MASSGFTFPTSPKVAALHEEQKKDLRIVFESIDRNCSGKIELGEFCAAMRRVDPLIQDEALKAFFSRLDVDNDKCVSWEDFSTFVCDYLPSYCEKKGCFNLTSSQELKVISLQTVNVTTLESLGVSVNWTPNPMGTNPVQTWRHFVTNDQMIRENVVKGDDIEASLDREFMRAGPRKNIAYDPKDVKAAIVTCGGLCPGENSVIRELVNSLYDSYGVREIYGVQYGFQGFYTKDFLALTPKSVANIHHIGGTVLGSSRGGFDKKSIVDALVAKGINQVYCIGGDGTHRGAEELFEEIKRRKLKISIGCVPKTIDNDFQLIDHSFGFYTAVEEAQRAIQSAKIEAEGAINGIGLVKLMGRQSGFIALLASLASRDVDYCLIPEIPFHQVTLLRHLKKKLQVKGNAVIVVAEGAGAHLGSSGQKDKSGNPILIDIGVHLKKAINDFFAEEKIEVTLKYIDPTYMIRSIPANATDSIYCSFLSQNCVHGVMAGFTGFTVGLINTHYAYLPIPLVTTVPKQVNPYGKMWYRLLESTNQPDFSDISNIFVSLADAVEHELKKKEEKH